MKILAEPIEVVVWFEDKKKPHPLKFRYQDDKGVIHRIKIDHADEPRETKLAGVRAFIYSCQSLIGNEEKRYELKYIISEYRWELYKM